MLKKRIKAIAMACMLVCILPTISFALDKEEFLKFLIDTSYPESNTKEDTNTSSETIDKKSKSNTKKEDVFEVYVGEENAPRIENEENTVALSSAGYINDLRVTSLQPRILIYHTHGCETYSNSPAGNYHSQDKANSVMEVGSLLTTKLTEKGWGVVHTTKYHDYNDFNRAYINSAQTLQEIMPNYGSVDIAIDLHRDGRTINDSVTKEKYHDEFTSTVDGKKVAKFSFVVGSKNSNAGEIRNLAQNLTNIAKAKYPDLIRPVVEKPYGKFNQSVAQNHMLIEVGSNATSIEEAKASADYIADVLDEYFKQQ